MAGRRLAVADSRILVALSRSVFRGEEEREIGFRSAIRERWPHRALLEITDSDGLDTSVYRLALDALDRHADIEAVYSIGGGNRAILDAFDARRRPCRAFIAHDLDRDNRELLEAGRLSAVLYHDLRRDMHRACQIIMQAHGALDGPIVTAPAPIQVITPFNIPPGDARSSAGGRTGWPGRPAFGPLKADPGAWSCCLARQPELDTAATAG